MPNRVLWEVVRAARVEVDKALACVDGTAAVPLSPALCAKFAEVQRQLSELQATLSDEVVTLDVTMERP